MTAAFWIRTAAVLGLLAVAAGAFGAHGLRARLQTEIEREAVAATRDCVGPAVPTAPVAVGRPRTLSATRRVEVYETGVRYHFWHALALLALGLIMLHTARAGPAEQIAGLGFSLGIVLFSGSLYVLALTGFAAWGIIPVFGGLAFLAGWAGLFLAAAPLR
jgi:uncharacterized membrane protein YgdD (TMEM256/DUF423 family)